MKRRNYQSTDFLPGDMVASSMKPSAPPARPVLIAHYDATSPAAMGERPLLRFGLRFNPPPKVAARLKRLKRLIGDQVLLRLIAPERHLHGLWIPDSAKREAWELWQGEVLAVGPGERTKTGPRKAMGVKVGDRCMFYSIGGKTATRWPSPEHVILSESYIQCVVEA